MFWWLNRIVMMSEGGAAGAPAEGGTVSTETAPATTEPTTEPAATAALTETLLTPPEKKEGEPPVEKPEDKKEPEKAPEKAPEPAAEIKPEDYKLDLPEGILADDPLLVAFLEGAAKGGMDNDSVQSVIASLGPKMVEQLAAPGKLWAELNSQWQAEIKADPVIGGANLDATIATVASAINLVSTPAEAHAAREAMNVTGAGNNPAIVRLLHRMASRLTEKGAVQGNSPADSRSAASVLYPTHSAARGG